MGRPKGEGGITSSVRVSPNLWMLAKKHNISLSEGLRVGLSIMLADLGEQDYDNNLNLYRKMRVFQKEAEKLSAEMEALRNKSNQVIARTPNNLE